MQILRNEVFRGTPKGPFGNAKYRVLDVIPKANALVLFELGVRPQPRKPFIFDLSDLCQREEEGEIEWITYGLPLIMSMDDDDISQKRIEERDRQFERIEGLVTDPEFLLAFASNGRSDRVVKEAKRLSLKPNQLYRPLYRFWEYGQQENALLGDTANCGAPGKDRMPSAKQRGAPLKLGKFVARSRRSVNIDEDDVGVFVEALRQVILKVRSRAIKFTYVNVYREVKSFSPYREEIEFAAADGRAAQIPTMRQFRYWLDKRIDRMEVDRTLLPPHVWAKDYRGLMSSASVLACVPGSRYEIDATIADVYIVSEFNRNIVLGRPTIYIVVCVSSRKIVGFHVSLKWASWACARQALYNAFTDKVAFCKRYGFEIDESEWAAKGVPARVFADRGEMIGEQPKVVTSMLGSAIQIAPPFRADAKGIVEREFGIANEELHITPGTTLGQLKERGYPDYRLKAVATLSEVTAILCSKFHLNNTTAQYDDLRTEGLIQEDLAPTPVNFWNHHMKHQQHALKHFSKDQIIAGLLPSVHASVCRDGIRSAGRRFTCERAETENWYSKARHSGRWQVEARGDLGWTSDLYIRSEGEASFQKCHLMQPERLCRNRHPDDMEYLYEWSREKKEDAVAELAALQHKDRSDKIIQDAIEEKANTPTDLTDAQRIKGIRQNRQFAVHGPAKVESAPPASKKQNSGRAVLRSLRLIEGGKGSQNGRQD